MPSKIAFLPPSQFANSILLEEEPLVDDWLKHRHPEARYVLNSFLVAVCHTTRTPRGKLLTGKAHHGRCASKRSWCYGLKVQVLATRAGVPVEFYYPRRRRVRAGRTARLAPVTAQGFALKIILFIFAHTFQVGL